MKRLIAFCFFLATATLSAYDQNVPTLTLKATGAVSKPADELQMKIGVITLQETAEHALQENSAKMGAIIEEIERLGLEHEDYETDHFAITPQYTPYPKNPPIGWKPSIIGYEVNSSIQIHTAKLDMIGKVIDLANKSGANSISDLRFGLRSSREYWTEAMTAAARHAVEDAQAIAKATGVKLVRVLSISLNSTQVRSPQLKYANLACEAMAAAPPPIEPGDVTIEANITIIYEIE